MENYTTLGSEMDQINFGKIESGNEISCSSYLSDCIINEEPRGNTIANFQGIRVYDLSDVHFINSNGLAFMIELMRTALKNGIEIQFVNICEKVKSKIKAIGIVHLFNCI